MPPRKRSNWRNPVVFGGIESARRTTRAARSGGQHSRASTYATKDGVTVNVSRSKEKVQGWIEVWRAPARGVGFSVPIWVKVEQLTPEERLEHLPADPVKEQEASDSIPHVDSALPQESSIAVSNTPEVPQAGVESMPAPSAPYAAPDTTTFPPDFPMQEATPSAPVATPTEVVSPVVPNGATQTISNATDTILPVDGAAPVVTSAHTSMATTEVAVEASQGQDTVQPMDVTPVEVSQVQITLNVPQENTEEAPQQQGSADATHQSTTDAPPPQSTDSLPQIVADAGVAPPSSEIPETVEHNAGGERPPAKRQRIDEPSPS
jgi:hypothetical protein